MGRADPRIQPGNLFREFRHLSAASRARRTHHVAALGSLLHRSLIVGHSLLFLTFHTKHFGQ